MQMIYAVKIAHGDHHAVEYGQLIGPLTSEQAGELDNAYDPSELIFKESTGFEEWQSKRAEWNEEFEDD